MYEAFYGLKDKPFSMLPDPEYLYLSKQHQTALTLLEYAMVNKSGFCVITGEPGAGKTTLLRKLLETLQDGITVGMITNTHKSFGGLMDWVLSAFNIHDPELDKVQQNQKFTDFLVGEYAKGRSVLLIVDEAQNMKAEALEELRMLSNVNSDKDQVLQIVLAGQPELKQMLRKPELMQFAQRIGVDYHLDTLDAQETCNYIQHRLRTAGATNDVFTPEACLRIYDYSGGTPRLINLICDTAMVYGFADQVRPIGRDIIDQMVQERMRDSVVPLFKDIAEKPVSDNQENASDIDFPWINPPGGARGVEADSSDKSLDAAVVKAAAMAATSGATEDEPAGTAADKPAPAQRGNDEKPADDSPEPAEPAEPVARDIPAQQQAATAGTAAVAPQGRPASGSNKWWFLGLTLLLAALLAVAWLVVNNNREIERMQLEAEKKLQLERELERKEQAAAELAARLEREKQEKLERERELQRQAEQARLLQKQRDEALKKAQREAAERARQQKLAEKIRMQKEAEKKRLMLEAEKRRLEAELQLQREQAALQERLRQQQLRLEQAEAEKRRRQAEKAAAEERARRLAAEKAAAEKAAREADKTDTADTEKPKSSPGFSSDPCSGPTARFLSSCR